MFDRPSERESIECLIKAKLRSIMMCQDLENVTSKQVNATRTQKKGTVMHLFLVILFLVYSSSVHSDAKSYFIAAFMVYSV